jgi:MFS family permease
LTTRGGAAAADDDDDDAALRIVGGASVSGVAAAASVAAATAGCFFFAAAAFCFFVGDGLWAWVTGMALFGIANAGGNVTWSLWVTKLAPPDAVAEYMSVHTFFTGLRGLFSPFIAFYLIQHISFSTLGIGCAVSILAASGFITVRSRSNDPDTSHRLQPKSRQERL